MKLVGVADDAKGSLPFCLAHCLSSLWPGFNSQPRRSISKDFISGWSHFVNPSWASVTENGSISPPWHHTTCGQWGGSPTMDRWWLNKKKSEKPIWRSTNHNIIYNIIYNIYGVNSILSWSHEIGVHLPLNAYKYNLINYSVRFHAIASHLEWAAY